MIAEFLLEGSALGPGADPPALQHGIDRLTIVVRHHR